MYSNRLEKKGKKEDESNAQRLAQRDNVAHGADGQRGQGHRIAQRAIAAAQ